MNNVLAVKTIQALYRNQLNLRVVWNICTDDLTQKTIEDLIKDPVNYKEIANRLLWRLYNRYGKTFKRAWKREDIGWTSGLREVLGRYLFLVCGADPVTREALKEFANGVYQCHRPYDLWTSLKHDCMEAYMLEKGSLLNRKGLRTALMILEGISGPLDKDKIKDEIIRIMEIKEYGETFEPWERTLTIQEFIDKFIKVYSELS